MQRWNWVMSVDIGGKWITTQGYAELELGEASLRGLLHFYGDGDGPYHQIDGTLDAENNVEVTVSSPPERDVAPFLLGGAIFRSKLNDDAHTTMILLTDGTTVLNLAQGPHSDEDNL